MDTGNINTAAQQASIQKASLEANIATATKGLDASAGAEQATSDENLRALSENPTNITYKKLEAAKKEVKIEKPKKTEESILVRKEDADSLADGFSQRQGNREYQLDPRLLSQLAIEELGIGINENSEPEAILEIIRTRMAVNGKLPHVSFVNKAFEFLIEVSTSQLNKVEGTDKERLSKIITRIETAKNIHLEANSENIESTQNLIGVVDVSVKVTGKGVQETIESYLDAVHNPREIFLIVQEYRGRENELKVQLKGFIRCLGNDFKKDVCNVELMRLADFAKKIQGILGVYRASKARYQTMESYFELNGLLNR